MSPEVSFHKHRGSMYAHVMSTFEPLVTLKLSIQTALLGEVTSRPVSVTCGVRGHEVKVRAYVSGSVTEQDTEMVGFVAAEVIADFPDGYTIAEECLSTENEPEEMLDFWAFRRADDEGKPSGDSGR